MRGQCDPSANSSADRMSRKHRCPTNVLRFTVRGGLSNQKECIVNAAIVAHALNMTLALPHIDLIGRGNERFEPNATAYVGPYAAREKWGHFTQLYNATRLISALGGQLTLMQHIRTVLGPGRPHIVSLPSDVIGKRCSLQQRVGDTCQAVKGSTVIIDSLIRHWRQVIAADTDCSPHETAPGSPTPALRSPKIYDAGQALCWNAYMSRFSNICARQYPICGPIVHALGWNRIITKLQQRVIRGLVLASNATASRATAPWVAVHVRAFVCAQNGQNPSFGHVLDALRSRGIRNGLVYLVSSIPVADAKRALPGYAVVAKTTFLGSQIRQKYPFEVLAAVDYGVATAAPLYLGEPRLSSFDAFAAAERVRRHGHGVIHIPGACGTGPA